MSHVQHTLMSERNFQESDGGDASCELIGDTSILVDLFVKRK